MRQRLLVELDALLDTRIGTIARGWPELASEFLNKQYATRISDEFNLLHPMIDLALYRQAYRERDAETLMASRPTELFYRLKTIMAALEMRMMEGLPECEDVKLDINIWPYELSNEVKEEIVLTLEDHCAVTAEVSLVSIPYQELTTDRILRDGWTFLYMYNYHEWLRFHFEKCDRVPTPIPLVTVIVPALVTEVQKVADFAKQHPQVTKSADPFESLHVFFGQIINIQVSTVDEFSLAGLVKGETHAEPDKRPASDAG